MFSINLLFIISTIIISINYISNIFAEGERNFQRENNSDGYMDNKTHQQSNERENQANQSVEINLNESQVAKKEQTNQTEHSDAIKTDSNKAKTYFINDDSENVGNQSMDSAKSTPQQKEAIDPNEGNKNIDQTMTRENLRVHKVSAKRVPIHQIILKRIEKELNGNATAVNNDGNDESKLVRPSPSLNLMFNAQEIVDRVNNDLERKWEAENFPHSNQLATEDWLRIAGRLTNLNCGTTKWSELYRSKII